MLKIGAAGLAGLSLPGLLKAEKSAKVAGRQATAKSVILLFQFGGASHLDSFDPKPTGPAEIRGEFKTIPTKVPGYLVTEHLPKLATRADKYAVVRSVRHSKGSHNSGAYYSLVGREPLIDIVTANASATDFPHPGSIVDHLTADSHRTVPASVALPWMIADGPFRTPGEFAGFLGKMHDPLWAIGDPNSPSFNVSELVLPDGIDVKRVADRTAIRDDLARLSRLADRADAVKGMHDYQARAVDLLTSPQTRQAFAINEESAALRDRYGRNTYGQSCLVARRLVEAGVRFVTVYYSPGIIGWDTHKDNFSTLKNSRLPHTDAALSALLDDLTDRGLIDDTLVYWTGDFGRTPKINKDAGRDHWPACQSVVMFGGGVRGGLQYGTSDTRGAYPRDNPLRPDDITATIFHALGLDPATEIRDQLRRPMPISAGHPIKALFG
ncbi:hypothetical protein FRUB_00210 [Fimbriiglobus ruber]|uniref:DUF1501 domain-containing protein n=2 Tax=Fimbriiglobus ruber TaxID=1908690 RepID=A0A225DYT6_9BACT|nr:hypothetical protein FRUB_00210 [Fimbriiglobus ruber]